MKYILQAIRDNESELRSFLRNRVSDVAIAEDLLQDVTLRAILQGHKFSEVRQPRAWLFRVTRNVLIDYNRRKRSTQELPLNIAQVEQEPETIDLLTECISRNLARINSADKEIIEYCDLKNQTVKAYANSKNISLSAAKAHLLRARKRLRESIETHCYVSFDESGKVCGYIAPS